MLALAAFTICAVTGIMLVPAFKPDAPLDSLALLLLKNPAGLCRYYKPLRPVPDIRR